MEKSFSHKTRVGNWIESYELENTKKRDFEIRRENKASREREIELVQATLSKNVDGFVHYDSVLQLSPDNAIFEGGVLAFDMGESVHPTKPWFAVTVSPFKDAVTRNTFKVVHYCEDDDGDDDLEEGDGCIKYGDKILFLSESSLGNGRTIYIRSQPVSQGSFSRYCRHQEVNTADQMNYSNVWEIMHVNPKLREELEGEKVSVSEAFILRHCATGENLAANEIVYMNDYGQEWEVCCHNFFNSHKGPGIQNLWKFVLQP